MGASDRTKRSSGENPHKSGGKPRQKGGSRGSGKGRSGSQDWIWGTHAALAAISNPDRTIHEVLITPAAAARTTLPKGVSAKTVEPSELDRLFGDSAHQGLAVRASAPRDVRVEDMAKPAQGLIVVLDQVTDPHNVGAIFRLCAAFALWRDGQSRGRQCRNRTARPCQQYRQYTA